MESELSETDVRLLTILDQLALAAGAVIMELRATGCLARHKTDTSPVTDADEQAEKIILDGLSAHFPNIPVVAEEAAAAGIVPIDLGTQFFLVDPLDGTKEFVAGRPDFTVNIALIEFGVPIAGVVYAPAHGTIFSATRGKACKSTVIDGIISNSVVLRNRVHNGPTRVVASRSHMNAETEAYLATVPNCEIVNIGSSLKFCILAEGRADLYPRFGRTMEWDTAAGDAVLRAVEGTTTTLDGAPLIYGKRNQVGDSDFANPYFVSASAKPAS